MEKLKKTFVAIALFLSVPFAALAGPFIDPPFCQPPPPPEYCVAIPKDIQDGEVLMWDEKAGKIVGSNFKVGRLPDESWDNTLNGSHYYSATMSTGNLDMQYGDIGRVGYAEMNNLIVIDLFGIYHNFSGSDGDIGWKIIPVTQPGVFNCTNTCPASCYKGEKANGMDVECSSYEAVQCTCPYPWGQ